jgi:hypothetical protein
MKHSDREMTLEEKINDVKMGRPHVVILGAGASLASFTNGDKNGRRLPLMENLKDVIGLDSLLQKSNIDYKGKNFEDIFSQLYEDKKYSGLVVELENAVKEYFLLYQMPETPTIYDHLVLSLREKDLIATFNWDPFLFWACYRNHKKAPLPNVVYLHGNVAIGYCSQHNAKGYIKSVCQTCYNPYAPSKLLFPIRNKNYNDDGYIKVEWNTLKHYLKNAYAFTIFGYSAPKTDVEAIKLMKEAWGDVNERQFEEVEIIDIKDSVELSKTWSPFIHTHHYQTTNDFYSSLIARNPRRSCETLWNQLMEVKFVDDNPLPKNSNFDELWKWYEPLLEAEKKNKKGKN